MNNTKTVEGLGAAKPWGQILRELNFGNISKGKRSTINRESFAGEAFGKPLPWAVVLRDLGILNERKAGLK
jgi:hypothetical protein